MIDLHTHILHGIDDGAQTLDESILLLEAEIKSGVHTVAMTPHFNISSGNLAEFIKKRDELYKQLRDKVRELELPIKLICGAEVAYSSDMLNSDLEALCFENTKAILIEMPLYNYPTFSRDVFFNLLMEGYTPIIAHAERYPYFFKTPGLLEALAESGVLIQVNAFSLLSGYRERKRVVKMILAGLVQILATDTHSINRRPPDLDKAVKVVAKKLGDSVAKRLVSFEV